MSDGTRKVTGISEITGMEGDVITMQDIFVFERTGIGPDGKVIGRFRATGIRPKCSDRLAAAGMPLPRGHVRARQGRGLKGSHDYCCRHVHRRPRADHRRVLAVRRAPRAGAKRRSCGSGCKQSASRPLPQGVPAAEADSSSSAACQS